MTSALKRFEMLLAEFSFEKEKNGPGRIDDKTPPSRPAGPIEEALEEVQSPNANERTK